MNNGQRAEVLKKVKVGDQLRWTYGKNDWVFEVLSNDQKQIKARHPVRGNIRIRVSNGRVMGHSDRDPVQSI